MVPAVSPVTTPVGLTDAIPGTALLHVPPGMAFVSVIDCPTHTGTDPSIAAGIGFTVTSTVLMHPSADV